MFDVQSIRTTNRGDPTQWMREVEYVRCESVDHFLDYTAPAFETPRLPISLDWETTSLNLYRFQPPFPASKLEPGKPVGLSVSLAPKTAMYVPLGHLVRSELNIALAPVLDRLKALDAARIISLWYNFKYDGQFSCQAVGWEPTNWRDVMTAVFLENNAVRVYGLKPTVDRLLGLTMIDFETVLGESPTFEHVDPDDAMPYACADADMPQRLFRLPSVQRATRQQVYIYKLEHLVSPVIREGMADGQYLSRPALEKLQREATVAIEGGVIGPESDDWLKILAGFCDVDILGKTHARQLTQFYPYRGLRQLVFDAAGGEFDINSPQKVGNKLLQLGVPITERTEKSKQVATGKEILEKYAKREGAHPILSLFIKYNELDTQKTNYIDKLLSAYDYFGPLAHFSFHHIGVPTGRMKSGSEREKKNTRKGANKEEEYSKGLVDLNVQSIPDPDKKPYLPNIRAAFVANPPDSDEFVFVSIDYCLAPWTRVLTADLRWVPVEQVRAGDRLVAIDEETVRRGSVRKMRTASVQRVGERTAFCYEIYTSDGRCITASAEHPWLSKNARTSGKGASRDRFGWVRTKDLRPGDRLSKLVDPWDPDGSREAGYLAGLFDGEGSFSRENAVVTLTQKEGDVMNYARGMLAHQGYTFSGESSRGGGFDGSGAIHWIWACGVAQVMQFIGKVRPTRFLKNVEVLWEGKEARSHRRNKRDLKSQERVRVTRVVPVGEQRVVSLQTSTHTFVAEGFFTHNSQIELRVCANLSREPTWIDAFQRGVDIHARNAQLSYADPRIGKEDPRRKFGKTMGFAVLFGAADTTVAEHGNIPVPVAKKLRETFFSNARVLGTWIERVQSAAQYERSVKTVFGRVRPLPDIGPESPRWLQEQGKRFAVNTMIQGSAADYFKIALTRIRKLVYVRGWREDVKQTMWDHDEVCLRVRRSMVATVIPELVKVMEFPIPNWPVPIKVDPEVGESWGQLQSYKEWIARHHDRRHDHG